MTRCPPTPPGSSSTRSPSTPSASSPTSPTRSPTSPKRRSRAIFTGKITEWSKVPGATATGPIDIISRTSTAGVLTNFKSLFLGNKSVSTRAAEEPSEGLLEQQVESTPGAIGFLSNYRADNGSVNAVGYNGVGCTLANATSGQYSGVARFYEVTKGKATGAASKFISWIDTSKAAKKIISSEWIPLSEAPR